MENCREGLQTVDAKPATTGRQKLAGAAQAEAAVGRKQIRDEDEEEGR